MKTRIENRFEQHLWASRIDEQKPRSQPKSKISIAGSSQESSKNMTSEELRFAQYLASNDRKTRDHTLARLRKWINLRSQRQTEEFNEEGMIKLWKGLFYSMWMADKPLIQEELADSISSLIHAFSKPSQIYVFVGCFFKIMGEKHDHIDKFRIDKFLMFTRRFFRSVLFQRIPKCFFWSLTVRR